MVDSVFSILQSLEETSSKLQKVEILKNASKNTEFALLLDSALNFKRKFHIKKFEIKSLAPTRYTPVSVHEFMGLLSQLEDRLITGDNAKKEVENFFSRCDNIEAKWYSRILRKDLRCGFDISTTNKAGFNIPEFEVMLAKDGKDNKNIKSIVNGGVFVSPKLDGYRCIAICDDGDVQLLSRNGTEYANFPDIVQDLATLSKGTRFVLDGEIMSNDFNKMQQSAFASVRGTTVGDVCYHVFGFVNYDEWHSDNFKMLSEDRDIVLSSIMKTNTSARIKQVKQYFTNSMEMVLELEREFMSQGYEGAMVLPNIPYFRGRKSNRLMKFKTMLSQDCKVIGAYEGTGKYEGSLGGLKLIQENGKECDVGSGFTDDERAAVWKNSQSVIGRTLEIKYQELTPDGIMRFPTVKQWRIDK